MSTHVLLDIYDFMKKRQMGCLFDCELFSEDKTNKKSILGCTNRDI